VGFLDPPGRFLLRLAVDFLVLFFPQLLFRFPLCLGDRVAACFFIELPPLELGGINPLRSRSSRRNCVASYGRGGVMVGSLFRGAWDGGGGTDDPGRCGDTGGTGRGAGAAADGRGGIAVGPALAARSSTRGRSRLSRGFLSGGAGLPLLSRCSIAI